MFVDTCNFTMLDAMNMPEIGRMQKKVYAHCMQHIMFILCLLSFRLCCKPYLTVAEFTC